MPMHDWTRVEPNIYHHFHGRWVFALADVLNRGLLPAEYYALGEQSAPPIVPDVLTLHAPGAGRNGPAPADGPPAGPGVATVTAAPPRVRFAVDGRGRPPTRGRRRVAVRHNSDHRLVAVVEILSPANKATAGKFRAFVGKVVGLLGQGVNALLIDPFPPTPRDPNGVHAAVWRSLTRERFTPPAGQPLTLAAYAAVGGNRYAGYVEPFAVGDALTPMPLLLTAEAYVSIPLEETYRQAWDTFPDLWRRVLEG